MGGVRKRNHFGHPNFFIQFNVNYGYFPRQFVRPEKESETQYLSLGYQAFFTLITINAIVLGTWSFSVESESLPLITRLLRTFDLLHRAGLWEMSGQLLFTCSLTQSAIVLTNGKNTTTGKIKDIHLKRSERIAIVVGILFLLVGALVESTAINNIA